MSDEVKEIMIDKETVKYLIYLLYKANFLTRYNVKSMLDIIEKDHPKDIVAYLLAEINKI